MCAHTTTHTPQPTPCSSHSLTRSLVHTPPPKHRYSYPWLDHTGLVQTTDMHVAPLFKHIFSPAVAPTLAFIGLLWKSLRFPQFELQVWGQVNMHMQWYLWSECVVCCRCVGVYVYSISVCIH